MSNLTQEILRERLHYDLLSGVAAGYAAQHALGFTGTSRQVHVLEKIGLPTRAPDAKRSAVRAMMALDKKRDSTGLRMVLLEDFESPVIMRPDDATVQAAFAGIDLAG